MKKNAKQKAVQTLPPVFIIFMLDVYCLAEIEVKSKAREEALQRAKKENLVTVIDEICTGVYKITLTERGQAYVDMVKQLPLPVAQTVYVDPRTLEN